MNRKSYTIVAIMLFIGFVLFNLRLNHVTEELRYQIEETAANASFLNSEISSLQSEIYEMKEKQKWVSSEEFEANNEKTTGREVSLGLKWSFREIEKDADVYIQYRERNGKWIKQLAEKTGDNEYKTEFRLHPAREYEYRIMSDGSVQRADDIKPIPFELYRMIALYPEIMSFHMQENGRILAVELEVWQHQKPAFDLFDVKEVAMVLYTDKKGKRVPLKGKADTEYEGRKWHYQADFKNEKVDGMELEVMFQNGCIQRENIVEIIEGNVLEEPWDKISCWD
ncbi:hypothetical protein J7I93_22155 [Bacillus sp. ISL-47]|uniref:hypothetical protein n=1 Tax=Bacillus sp. ISL-47 TaxID=2819130 RepID=UPI001BE8710D|nr:hypothetical protein [Bacillus sp. ISL-47]MBT2690845.1 hypothetical protein [Bacillus sp. ISL-47]MBT2710796.1 hypothetical protein [Pseudomonas sp. ISL-84]